MNEVSKSDFWDKCYNDNNIGWDLGSITPVFQDWADNLSEKSKILVPGSGNGYDPLYFSNLGHDVVAVDFSREAIKSIKQKANSKNLKINALQYDFFDLKNKFKDEFDFIVEYTFFCAIDPKKRIDYINIAYDLLKDDGYLIGLFLPLNKDASEGGPPFAVKEDEIKSKFSKKFNLIDSYMHPLSIDARKNNEKYYVFKKK